MKVSATTSCILDPMPQSFLKKYLEDFLTILRDNFNTSLHSGKFLDKLNNVAVRPLLKKVNLL